MKSELKDTFDKFCAEERIKNNTKAFLIHKTNGYQKNCINLRYKRFVPVVLCIFILMGWMGYQIYFASVSTICIDINPSMELGINRFDKIISVEGYNADGKELTSSFKINFMNYMEALKKILVSDRITQYLSQDEIVSITVVGDNVKQKEEILSKIEDSIEGQKNIYCCTADKTEVAVAHVEGLSYGKYKMFLELRKYDPGITPEQVQQMTMREIRDLIADHTSKDLEEAKQNENKENRGNGQGKRSGRKK